MQDQNKREPVNIFSKTNNININSKHWEPFGCPVYVLDNALQAGQIYHKWKDQARVGIYLGKSPQHACNVALVLSLETGLISPQFHIKFDPSFHTVKQEKFVSSWQLKAGFVSQREKVKVVSKQEMTKRKTDKRASRHCMELQTKQRCTTQPEGAQQRIKQPIVKRIQDPQQHQQLNPSEEKGQTGNPTLEGRSDKESSRTTTKTQSGRISRQPN